MFKHLRLRVRSHGFICDELSPTAQKACFGMSNQLVQYAMVPQRGRMVREAQRVYACANAQRSEFRFLINHLEKFKRILQTFNIDWKFVQYEETPYAQPSPFELELNEKWVLRDYQVPIVEFIARQTQADYERAPTQWKPVRTLLPLQTGFGKGLTSMVSAQRIGWRCVLLIRPMYHDKWISEICEYFGVSKDQVQHIQGSASLLKLLKQGSQPKTREKIKSLILISNKTYQVWLKNYERFGTAGTRAMGYACDPGEFYEHIGAGTRIIDEAHLDFHLCCKADMYTHVHQSISLTATLINKDAFLSRLYYDVYPAEERYKAPPLVRYADVFAVLYAFERPEAIQTTERGSSNFSNNQVEVSILKNPNATRDYLLLIDRVLAMGFDPCTRERKKVAVYAYNTPMIDTITQHLQRKYPARNVCRYMSEDDYDSNLIASDIVITTTGSAGTALHIPDLTHVICTMAISSQQLNIQLLGRLRPLKDGHDVQFHYLVPVNLEKPFAYHRDKLTLYKDRVKSHHEVHSGMVVKN